MKYLIKISVLLLFIFTSFIQNENIYDSEKLKDKLLGKWIYQHSWVTNKKVSLQENSFNPIYSIEFLKCNDSIDLKNFPIVVKNIRKKNHFNNIKSIKCFLDGRETETYPTLLKTVNNRHIIKYYGRKYKGLYSIDSLSEKKMVIKKGKNTFHVYHHSTDTN